MAQMTIMRACVYVDGFEFLRDMWKVYIDTLSF